MFDVGKRKTQLSLVALVFLVSVLVGCSLTPKEVTAADQAVAAAIQAGKNKECPNEFAEAERLKNEAVALCKPCHTKEAIAKANEALARVSALCPAKPVAAAVETRPVAPTPAPVRAPAATASLSASPASIQQGQCSTLTWSTTNATGVSIDPGVGKVDPSGSRQVCPDKTTQYRASATGAGDSGSASTTVTVTHVVDKLSLHVNFDFNKATIRKPDDADLQKAIAFIKKYPGAQINLVGHTDSIGGDAFNLRLSERRAEAVKDYLVKHGIDAARIQTSGRGKADPIGDNKTEKGRAENRRVEVQILSE
jgi:outer membrane protein OmpA-like peptidoglycan-associated protein